ncbi:MAG: hypothetical protein CMJ87_06680 [Planctomycetes bacterium]|nr:hypothetical protein [Planctomycetota bacterium]
MNLLLLPALLAPLFPAPAPLAGPTQQVASELLQRTQLTVRADGVSEHKDERLGPAPTPGAQPLTSPGSLWTHTDGGAAWIAKAVSIGDVSGQVFAEYDLNNESVELLSAFDTDPPTPIWTDTTPLGTDFHMVDSAAETATHVAMDQVTIGGDPMTRQAVLRKYTSSSATPDWTYTFTPLINAAGKVSISRDGGTIVAAIMNSNTASVEIAVFDPNSATPLSYTVLPPGTSNSLRGWDLSSDGSTLYFTQSNVVHIFDVASATVTFTTNIGSGFDSHAISGDGSVFAYGRFNTMHVWERSGATYSNTFTDNLAGQVYCAQIDISDDSSTVAYGWYFYSPGLVVQVNAYHLPSAAVTMTDVINGMGAYQNLLSDIDCAANGERFAVGLWGDEGGLAEEVRVYSRSSDTPLLTKNLPGSVFDIDISADGQRVVSGSKSAHANSWGNGGQVDLVDVGGEDLMLRGAPRIGATVDLMIYGPSGDPTFFLSASTPQDPPLFFPAIGTLHVNRATVQITYVGVLIGGGEFSFPLANDTNLVGTSLYGQVLFLEPRLLTSDWLKLTYLP